MNLFLQIVSLLILCGDIEENPGPVSGSSNEGIFSKESRIVNFLAQVNFIRGQ